MNRKLATIGSMLGVLLAIDIATKKWALAALPPHGFPADALGGLVPMTLTFNTGVAFGFGVGNLRWFIITGTVLVLCALGVLLVQARRDDALRLWSLGAVMAGAMGNLIDRVRWDRGVVDFIGPFNLFGVANFPIFNVADMAITMGAAALAFSLWQEERQLEADGKLSAIEPSTSTDIA